MSHRPCTPVSLRFAQRLHSNPDACWEWAGAKNEHGYGVIGRGRRSDGNTKAHRVSYQIFHGAKLTPSELVLHRCDNPSCVNPLHLWVGTPKENSRDMLEKGRGTPPPVRRGVENNKAKLDEIKIQQIFHLRNKGHTTYEIAEIFGVSRSAICSALNRHTWRHVDVTYYFR